MQNFVPVNISYNMHYKNIKMCRPCTISAYKLQILVFVFSQNHRKYKVTIQAPFFYHHSH